MKVSFRVLSRLSKLDLRRDGPVFAHAVGHSPDSLLYRWTSEAKAWCADRGLDLSINPLTLACLGGQIYPELPGRVKASRGRNLLSFTCHYVVCLDPCPQR